MAGLAGRYATALFELAESRREIDTVAASLQQLRAALAESPDFAQLTTSPLVDRQQAGATVLRVADAMGLDPLTRNFMGVLARNGRLAQLGSIITAFGKLAAAHRGEITAEVTSAHPLSDAQLDALRAKLKAGLGASVAVDLTVDPAILGGLVVKVGSRMIDSSLRTKIDTLGQAMKG